jgi:membrane protease YdiL (CAAX protease family)
MEKLNQIITEHSVIAFLALTFAISLLSFILMSIISEAQTPETMKGLPVWLIAIWSPNIAAINHMDSSEKNCISRKFKLAFSITTFIVVDVTLVLIPLLIVAAVILLMIEVTKGNTIQWSNFEATSSVLPLVFINLIMGPLGEELGWRGFLYPILKSSYGWMGAALIVGVIWAILACSIMVS